MLLAVVASFLTFCYRLISTLTPWTSLALWNIQLLRLKIELFILTTGTSCIPSTVVLYKRKEEKKKRDERNGFYSNHKSVLYLLTTLHYSLLSWCLYIKKSHMPYLPNTQWNTWTLTPLVRISTRWSLIFINGGHISPNLSLICSVSIYLTVFPLAIANQVICYDYEALLS